MISVAVEHRLSRGQTARRRLRRPPFAIWFPVAVYALMRLIDLGFILLAQRHQVALPDLGKPAHPGYAGVVTNWDGQWYRSIAQNGYPSTLPRQPTGAIAKNAWGFYPAYPLTVGALTRLTGLGFNLIAPLLSTVLGAGAMVVMYRLLNQTAGKFAASATIVLASAYMAAPVMQIAYTESMALLLTCSALLLLHRRRYGWFGMVLILLALTRPVALVFVPVLCWHGIWRYRRRALEPFPTRDRLSAVGVGLLGVIATGLWPAIAAGVTGIPSAYTQTMSSWGSPGDARVLTGWVVKAWEWGGPEGLATLAGASFLFVLLAVRRGAKAWGPEVCAWAVAYPTFILLTTPPGSSSLRHLFLAFPLMWPLPEQPTSFSDRRLRLTAVALLTVIGLASQWLWIDHFLVVSTTATVGIFP